jgi:hypothetical protein
MTTLQTIARHLEALPEADQREVLYFVEFLESKRRPEMEGKSDATWSAFSLASAMRGMEDEPSPYTVADVKESFR